MFLLILTGIKFVVIEGVAFAHLVMNKFLPHFCLRVLLSADLAALRAVDDPGSIHNVVLTHSCHLPISVVPIVSSVGLHLACTIKSWFYNCAKLMLNQISIRMRIRPRKLACQFKDVVCCQLRQELATP